MDVTHLSTIDGPPLALSQVSQVDDGDMVLLRQVEQALVRQEPPCLPLGAEVTLELFHGDGCADVRLLVLMDIVLHIFISSDQAII